MNFLGSGHRAQTLFKRRDGKIHQEGAIGGVSCV